MIICDVDGNEYVIRDEGTIPCSVANRGAIFGLVGHEAMYLNKAQALILRDALTRAIDDVSEHDETEQAE